MGGRRTSAYSHSSAFGLGDFHVPGNDREALPGHLAKRHQTILNNRAQFVDTAISVAAASSSFSSTNQARLFGVGSTWIFWVEMLEFDPRIFGGELTIEVGNFAIAGIPPGRGVFDQGRLVGDLAIQTLPGQHIQFDLRHVQPASMLR